MRLNAVRMKNLKRCFIGKNTRILFTLTAWCILDNPIEGWYLITFTILKSKVYKIYGCITLALHGTLQLIFAINLLATFDSQLLIRCFSNICIVNKVNQNPMVFLNTKQFFADCNRNCYYISNNPKASLDLWRIAKNGKFKKRRIYLRTAYIAMDWFSPVITCFRFRNVSHI